MGVDRDGAHVLAVADEDDGAVELLASTTVSHAPHHAVYLLVEHL